MTPAMTMQEAAALMSVSVRVLAKDLEARGLCFYVGKRRRVTIEQLEAYKALNTPCPSSSSNVEIGGTFKEPTTGSASERLLARLSDPKRKRSGKNTSGKSTHRKS